MVHNGQAGAGFEGRGSSGKDLSYITRTTMGIGIPAVLLLSLVPDSPQALVAGLSNCCLCPLSLPAMGLGQRLQE